MFDDPRSYLWLIPCLPLAGAAVTAAAGTRLGPRSHWPCILAAVASCLLSLAVFLAVSRGFDGARYYLPWFSIGDVDVGISLRGDGLSAIMLVTVTFVGALIAVYSIGYMHGDPGYARYFACISLFLAAMTGLVLADNFILLYGCWEGVGLCSYLLIGFYYQKPSAAAAARKAFLVTRIGDVGLFIGILLLWAQFGSLDYGTIFDDVVERTRLDPAILTPICLLIFCGAAGKSAQFPLHVWLPDAMEGPSPVSALIHAATMVTAGVYLVARCTPLFGLAPDAQLVVAAIGGVTALLAALIALTQTDLKRVLAYSTVSQLGYMFMALGSGVQSRRLALLAVSAAIFHLFTHAFFKALLFLGAGSVMHAMGNVIDMRRFSGLRHVLRTTHWTFLCGALALAGFPLISGFWSKDEILAVLLSAGQQSYASAMIYSILFCVALVTAGLTAFYIFRAYFLTFWGETRIPHEAGHDAHEAPPVMLVPLQVLAIGALIVGAVFGPTKLFEGFLHHHWAESLPPGLLPAEVDSHFSIFLMLGGALFALGGIGVAWWIYVKKPATADDVARAAPAVYELSRNKFFLDEIYHALVVAPLSGLARVLRILDQYIVDGLIDLFAQVPRLVGWLCRPIQNGLVQFYALLMALGVGGFLLSVLLR